MNRPCVAIRTLYESMRCNPLLRGGARGAPRANHAQCRMQDPRVRVTILARGPTLGVDHSSMQGGQPMSLVAITCRLHAGESTLHEKAGAHYCYPHSHRIWSARLSGIPWKSLPVHREGVACGSDPDWCGISHRWNQ